ncbi:MAG TPA: GreA/GreB family elongation factor [Candidatus Sulfotelmatobacter sp.]|nr:GreA/GreB family elongation factor [Candidatus Sulfotelmatobacter sp.]
MQIIPFTKQGLDNLKKQLEQVLSQRPNAVKELTRGRDMGDLSENGLYKAAKQNLNEIDRTIRNLRHLIKSAKVFIPTNTDFVQVGHKVIVETEKGLKEFFIVGEYEANPREGKISHKSPIGHNLMGRKVGEEIKINIPSGTIKYLIKKIL